MEQAGDFARLQQIVGTEIDHLADLVGDLPSLPIGVKPAQEVVDRQAALHVHLRIAPRCAFSIATAETSVAWMQKRQPSQPAMRLSIIASE